MTRPLCIDLFCGLGGWTDGFLAEGYDVLGFDIERHVYGAESYPAQLVLQDVRTLHGAQFKRAAVIVASSPCQEFSYRAMPWKRAKALGPPLEGIDLFAQAARIQREASDAAGRWIPMIQENVRGAQRYVGPAQWHYGSFYLWGDVPALMPFSARVYNSGHVRGEISQAWRAKHYAATAKSESDGTKQSGISGPRANGRGDRWFQDGAAAHGSKSSARKAASARIAKIPFALAQHIARVWRPAPLAVAS